MTPAPDERGSLVRLADLLGERDGRSLRLIRGDVEAELRIPLEEVLAYKERRSHKRRELLAEMTADAVEMGMYGSPAPTGADDPV